MIAKKTKFKKIEPGEYLNYFRKSRDFHRAMRLAYEKGNWNSAGLEAVHCVISANDALLTFYRKVRSTSPDHREAVRLLIESIKTPDARRNAQHLRKVIAKKNLIEYEERLFTQKEAIEIIKHTERFFAWVKSMLPQPKR